MTLEPPKLDITLPRLALSELHALRTWAQERLDRFPTFAPWLAETVNDEINRRDSSGAEPGMMALPTWSAQELADALIGSYVLVHLPLTDSMAVFCDDLHRHVVCDCSAVLEGVTV